MVAEAEHWCVCSLLPFSAWGGGKQHSCHGNGSRTKGPADPGLSPPSGLLGRAGASRDKAQGTDHVQKLRSQSQSHTCTSISPRAFPQSTHGGTGTHPSAV